MTKLLFQSVIFTVYLNIALGADPSVIIVGAGPAGIAAATRLLENSYTNIKILEAENRIGGRVKTIQFGGSDIDEGAQYCHGEEGNVVYQTVKDMDLLQHSQPLTLQTTKMFYSNGSTFDLDLTQDLENIILNYDDAAQEAGDITGQSLGDAWLQQYNSTIIEKYSNDPAKLKIVKEALVFGQNLILMHEGAFHWEEPAAGRHYTACTGDQMMAWKTTGYGIIIDILTKNYPNPEEKLPIDDKILLNTTVTKISWNDKGVTVQTADSTTHSADHVIFTPSIGVLREAQTAVFDPQLPASKQEAVAAMGFDAIMKVILHFPVRWWKDEDSMIFFLWSEEDLKNAINEFPYGPSKNGISWVSQISAMVPVAANPNVVIAWVSGDLIPELEQTDEEILMYGCMYVIDKFLINDYNVTNPDDVLRSQWYTNPNFRGTYSFENTGYYHENVSYQAQLAEPLNNTEGRPVVLFAGEATSPKHYSTVHGAIESGHREADRIISLYKDVRIE